MKNKLIGCAWVIFVSSPVVVPALVATYYVIWEPLK